MDDYRKFMNRFRCEKGQAYTHTSIGSPKYSLHVPPENMAEFYEVYTRAMVKGTRLHLTEKPGDPSPMRIDLDFRFPMPPPRDDPNEPLPRVYTQAHVERILKAYYNIFVAFVDVGDNAKDILKGYVMEKPHASEYRGKLKDGIHVVWPNLVVTHAFQHMIRNHILEHAAALFAGMNLCNPFEDIIDQAIIDRNCWQMYGSRKPECEAYQVTTVYTWNDTLEELEEMPTLTATEELQLVELFSMRGKESKLVKLRESKQAEYEEYTRHILPSIDERRKLKLNGDIFGKSQNLTKNFVSEDEYILAGQLVSECLCYKRAENYEDWIKLGWTLRNIDHRLINAWIEFSRVSSKNVEGECQTLWNKMRIDTLGMGTLKWWARTDNPMKFKEILDTNVCQLIDQCVNSAGAHFDVAKVVHAMFKDEYRFTTKDTWYTYVKEKHRWVRTREGLKLRLILSQDICTKFMERGTHWNQEGAKACDESARLNVNTKVKMINEICMKLKSAGYKNSIMTECKGLFTDEKFEELLDSHPHLIGFENGVYDLKMHEFREGLADDYISFSTNRHYIDFVPDSLEVREINEYLSQVFTNSNVREYVKNIFSCIIDGSIRQEKFYVFTGSGSNSKSLILNLLQKAIGDYYCILPIALMTQKRAASNSAQSELERTKGRRFAIMQEPGEQERINVGLMKELSGGDRILARGLFKEPIEFKPQFTMIMTCNEMPEVPSDDGGTWRRIRVIEFLSKFVETPDPNNPLEFPLDLELMDKLERWADTFISMMIAHHEKMDPKNIQEPYEVRKSTESYKKNNDVIGQFAEEKMEKSDNESDTVRLNPAYMDFKSWAVQVLPKGKKVPDRTQFKIYVEKVYGLYPNNSKGWKGVRMKATLEEADSDVE